MRIEKRERFNFLTSLVGAVAAPVAVTALVLASVRQGDPWRIVSFAFYGGALLLLYTTATLYHAAGGRAKKLLRELDHHAIFILIAGTYTPFSLVTLRGGWGWTMFGLVWGFALFGVVQRLRPGRHLRIPELAIYLGMGWLIVVAIRPLLRAFPLPGVALLGLGGLFYTGGIVFYARDNRFSWAHGAWHLCVLAGSISHYLAVFLYMA
jgi:hemolysin III